MVNLWIFPFNGSGGFKLVVVAPTTMAMTILLHVSLILSILLLNTIIMIFTGLLFVSNLIDVYSKISKFQHDTSIFIQANKFYNYKLYTLSGFN